MVLLVLKRLKWSESTGDATNGPPGGSHLWVMNHQPKQLLLLLLLIVVRKHWTLVDVGLRLRPPGPSPCGLITGHVFICRSVGGEHEVEEKEGGGGVFGWGVVKLNGGRSLQPTAPHVAAKHKQLAIWWRVSYLWRYGTPLTL